MQDGGPAPPPAAPPDAAGEEEDGGGDEAALLGSGRAVPSVYAAAGAAADFTRAEALRTRAGSSVS